MVIKKLRSKEKAGKMQKRSSNLTLLFPSVLKNQIWNLPNEWRRELPRRYPSILLVGIAHFHQPYEEVLLHGDVEHKGHKVCSSLFAVLFHLLSFRQIRVTTIIEFFGFTHTSASKLNTLTIIGWILWVSSRSSLLHYSTTINTKKKINPIKHEKLLL